ncbi:GGDEF domain-containing protein [Trinickia symbiotica]|uniref:diguanylate cyclase n=1 Tax=Trinickia symbiotica TaxID=863227 RepID=A0A2T3XN36_9BURK|nr:GGDEF domain-containing protein [Trinickia symbiotica]PTB17941.1 GGDEF domain-containing protein [Trinickia symbiotica]
MLSPLALLGIVIVSCLMSVAILGSLLRTAVPGIGRWCVAHALLAAASSWVLIAGAQSGQFVMIGASLITLMAVLLLVQGMRQFFGKGSARHEESAAFVIVSLALVYFTYVSPNIDARVTLISIFLTYARIAVGTLALLHAPPDGARYPYRFVAAAAYLGALFHATRAAAVAFGMPQMAFLQPSPWNVLFLGLAIVTLPCMSTGMVMLAHDQLTRRMEQLASIDELTGALMRRAFMARANILLREALVSGKPLSIAILDIDKFKAVNDGFGHAAGDRILRHVTSAVSTRLRSCDLFGRLGGEEFAIVFVNAGKADAAGLTNDLRLAVERSPNQGLRCTFSAGVECVTSGDTLEGVLARADAALYMAKATGRNRVVTAPEVEECDVVEPD